MLLILIRLGGCFFVAIVFIIGIIQVLMRMLMEGRRIPKKED
jgi:hypothetical protein